jgi:putative Mn2+ efflux pump MntP
MNLFEILFIALSMAMDAFAVSLGVGSQDETIGRRPVFRLAFHFGFFQFFMPVVGWLAGLTIARIIANYDHWIAAGLLSFVGIRMIISGVNPGKEDNRSDPSRGWTLVLLSIAVSIDALAVGLSLGIIGSSIWFPAVIIGVITGLLSWLGLRLGNKLGEKFGKRMEISGGVILILIGVRIIIDHLAG